MIGRYDNDFVMRMPDGCRSKNDEIQAQVVYEQIATLNAMIHDSWLPTLEFDTRLVAMNLSMWDVRLVARGPVMRLIWSKWSLMLFTSLQQ